MLWRDQERGSVWALLSSLVLLAMFINSVAWVFCPHMAGSSAGCFTEHFAAKPHKHVDNVGREEMHCSDMGMAEMHMESTPDDVALADPSSQNPSTAAYEIETPSDITAFPLTEIHGVVASAVTQPINPCSHCAMHAQPWSNLPLSSVVVSNSFDQSIAPLSSSTVPVLTPLHILVDVHDHGPPSRTSSRYILNSSFRI